MTIKDSIRNNTKSIGALTSKRKRQPLRQPASSWNLYPQTLGKVPRPREGLEHLNYPSWKESQGAVSPDLIKLSTKIEDSLGFLLYPSAFTGHPGAISPISTATQG